MTSPPPGIPHGLPNHGAPLAPDFHIRSRDVGGSSARQTKDTPGYGVLHPEMRVHTAWCTNPRGTLGTKFSHHVRRGDPKVCQAWEDNALQTSTIFVGAHPTNL
jgi:hypothetical protein